MMIACETRESAHRPRNTVHDGEGGGGGGGQERRLPMAFGKIIDKTRIISIRFPFKL